MNPDWTKKNSAADMGIHLALGPNVGPKPQILSPRPNPEPYTPNPEPYTLNFKALNIKLEGPNLGMAYLLRPPGVGNTKQGWRFKG